MFGWRNLGRVTGLPPLRLGHVSIKKRRSIAVISKTFLSYYKYVTSKLVPTHLVVSPLPSQSQGSSESNAWATITDRLKPLDRFGTRPQ
jgi:hypothetical protein